MKVATRGARDNDYASYVRLHQELGVDDAPAALIHFQTSLSQRMLIAEADGHVEPVGYAIYELLRGTGYIRSLVTDPAARRQGVGRQLMTDLRQRFLAAEATRWCLNVKANNVPARTLYLRLGLTDAYASTSFRLPPGLALPPLPPQVAVEPSAMEDDAEIEVEFDMLPGLLSASREKPRREILALRRGSQRAGIAVLSSSVPSAFPFRVCDPSLALGFAGSLHTRSGSANGLVVVVENDEQTRSLLAAAGASTVHELIHMRGALTYAT